MKNDFLNLYSETNVGNKRPANEDFLGYSESPNGLIYVVCDGMGGHVGGATASQLAVNSILEFMSIKAYENIYVALSECIIFANQEILNKAVENPDLKGMGTTCTVIVAREPEIFIAHVGDSRIYLQRNDQLYRLTKDHSFVQDLVDQGVITDEETETHPRKNQILKALGISSSLEPSVHSAPIHPTKGDKFLMCTDGLNGEINDEKINSIFNSHTEINKVGEELIKSALDAGGKDNVTLEIIEVLSSPFKESVFPNYNPVSHLKTDPENNDLKTTIIIDKAPKNLKAENNNLKMILAAAFMVIIVGVVLIFLNEDEHKIITNEISLETEQTVENTNEAEKQDDSTDINSEDDGEIAFDVEEEENVLINRENSNNLIKKNKEKPKSRIKKKKQEESSDKLSKTQKDDDKQRILDNANNAFEKAKKVKVDAVSCLNKANSLESEPKSGLIKEKIDTLIKNALTVDSLLNNAYSLSKKALDEAKRISYTKAKDIAQKACDTTKKYFRYSTLAINKLNSLKTKLNKDLGPNSDTDKGGPKKSEVKDIAPTENNVSIANEYFKKEKTYNDRAKNIMRDWNKPSNLDSEKSNIKERAKILSEELDEVENKINKWEKSKNYNPDEGEKVKKSINKKRNIIKSLTNSKSN